MGRPHQQAIEQDLQGKHDWYKTPLWRPSFPQDKHGDPLHPLRSAHVRVTPAGADMSFLQLLPSSGYNQILR